MTKFDTNSKMQIYTSINFLPKFPHPSLTYLSDLTVSNWKRKYFKADGASSCYMPSNKPSKLFFEKFWKLFILKSHFRRKTAACWSVLQGTTRGWYWVCIQQRQFISTCTGLKLGEVESTLFLHVCFSACYCHVSAFQCLTLSPCTCFTHLYQFAKWFCLSGVTMTLISTSV